VQYSAFGVKTVLQNELIIVTEELRNYERHLPSQETNTQIFGDMT